MNLTRPTIFLGRSATTALIRHLSAVSNANGMYELRIYQMKPEFFRESLEMMEKFWPVRTAHSKDVGSWITEIGGICEVAHLWKYESMSDRTRKRQKVAEDPVWQKEFLPIFFPKALKLTNSLIVPKSGTTLTTDISPSSSALYELQICESHVPLMTSSKDEIVIGQFSAIYGPIATDYLLVRYTDPDVAYEKAIQRRNAWNLKGFSRLMVPCKWSPLK